MENAGISQSLSGDLARRWSIDLFCDRARAFIAGFNALGMIDSWWGSSAEFLLLFNFIF